MTAWILRCKGWHKEDNLKKNSVIASKICIDVNLGIMMQTPNTQNNSKKKSIIASLPLKDADSESYEMERYHSHLSNTKLVHIEFLWSFQKAMVDVLSDTFVVWLTL